MSEQPRHFVVGDTHGRSDFVERLIDSNVFNPTRDFVYFLGDYYPHYDREGTPSGDIHELMELLNRCYNPDITKPGFHLIRGNNEWKGNRLNDVFGDIMIAACPDIVVLKIEGITFCLSHCGMEKTLWDKIRNSNNAEYHLSVNQYDNLFSAIVNERKGDFSFSDKSENEAADYWPKDIDNAMFIHGHLPAHKDGEAKKTNGCYNYYPTKHSFEKDEPPHGLVRINDVRHAMNIDTGVCCSKNNPIPCLACVCLEDFITCLDDKETKFCNYVF